MLDYYHQPVHFARCQRSLIIIVAMPFIAFIDADAAFQLSR